VLSRLRQEQGSAAISTFLFHGEPILVTGASSGIGRATARLLAERGAKVFLVARRPEALQKAVDEIRAKGGVADGYAADVADRTALNAAIDAAEAAFGPLYGVFANAGLGGGFAPIGQYDDAHFEAILRTNVVSPFWMLKRVLPGMLERGRGAVLFTGSLASERGMGNSIGYAASKHAVVGLSRTAAMEGASRNVRSNCVLPGFIDTQMMAKFDAGTRARVAERVPQKRLGTAEEVAEVAAFLLSDAASHVTGQVWSVDGGVLGTLSV
jgi:NAD(P)-dependent dehydrogenase (short-subunit alcohol dehydrogenase family)